MPMGDLPFFFYFISIVLSKLEILCRYLHKLVLDTKENVVHTENVRKRR